MHLPSHISFDASSDQGGAMLQSTGQASAHRALRGEGGAGRGRGPRGGGERGGGGAKKK